MEEMRNKKTKYLSERLKTGNIYAAINRGRVIIV
jgi:hypothetical protein